MREIGQRFDVATHASTSAGAAGPPPPAHLGSRWSGISNCAHAEWPNRHPAHAHGFPERVLDRSPHPPGATDQPLDLSVGAAGAGGWVPPSRFNPEYFALDHQARQIHRWLTAPTTIQRRFVQYREDRQRNPAIGTFPQYLRSKNWTARGLDNFSTAFRPEALGLAPRPDVRTTPGQAVKEYYVVPSLNTGPQSVLDFAASLGLHGDELAQAAHLSAKVNRLLAGPPPRRIARAEAQAASSAPPPDGPAPDTVRNLKRPAPGLP